MQFIKTVAKQVFIKMIIILQIILFLFVVLLIQAHFGGIVVNINQSNSFDEKIILSSNWFNSYKKGDYIIFDHPLFKSSLCKQIAGIAGDTIEIKNTSIYVQGVYKGQMLDKSPYSGKSLTWIKEKIIPDGYVYVYAPHKHSFDSRYQDVGLIEITKIQSKAWPIF